MSGGKCSCSIINLCIDKGADFTHILIYKDSSGTPISLTGYNAEMFIKQSPDSPTSIIELTTSNGRIILEEGGDTGQIKLTLTNVDTVAIPDSRGFYDLILISPTSIRDKLFEGIVTFNQLITL